VRRRIAIAVMAAGFGLMAFATQTADEVQDPVPHKVELAHWLETGLWVQPWLLFAGAVVLLAGVVVAVLARERRTVLVGAAALVLPLLAVVASGWILLASLLDWRLPNLTGSFPQ
jgi:hypothetical protein